MRIFNVILFLVLITGCSFDDKSGIWKNENNVKKNNKNTFEEFKELSSINQPYNKIVKFNKNKKITLSKTIKNQEWKEKSYNASNNFENFKYSNQNKLIFNSSKISRSKLTDTILFEKGNVISSDQKGNIIIYSIEKKKVIVKFNFYKNKYKNIKKNINFLIENQIIYATDNIGYFYAFNYDKNKILWAKNYKIPFRSNVKIFKNKLITSNQNNDLYFINKNNGEILRLIPTEDTTVKNNFINNLSLGGENTYFLNTFGSLYAFNNITMKMKWFLNLKQNFGLNTENLFSGNQIINDSTNVVVSSSQFLYVLNSDTGRIVTKKNIISTVKPLINNNHIFLITENDLLIALDINNGEIIYSYDINQKIAKFLNSKKKEVQYKNIMLANNKIFIFLNNSFYLIFKINGELTEIRKLPTKLYSEPIFIEDSILYLNNRNKISIVN